MTPSSTLHVCACVLLNVLFDLTQNCAKITLLKMAEAPQDPVVVKTEPGVATAADRILAICAEIPEGVSDKILKV